MCAAAQLQILRRRCSSVGERDHMVEFKESSLRTTPVRTNKSTSAIVARPDLTPDCRRDVSAFSLTVAARPRTIRPRELPSLEIVEQQGQRAVKNNGGITIRHNVAHQVLNPSQLVMRFLADRDLHFVALGCERDHGLGTTTL